MLAVDLGSTGIKVAVVDAHAAVRAVAGEVIPLLFVDGGGVEQDPRIWWDALGRCARKAIGEALMFVASDGIHSLIETEIEDLICEHSQVYSREQLGFTEYLPDERAMMKPVRHRLVRTNPATGRRSLYLSSHIGGIVGWLFLKNALHDAVVVRADEVDASPYILNTINKYN